MSTNPIEQEVVNCLRTITNCAYSLDPCPDKRFQVIPRNKWFSLLLYIDYHELLKHKIEFRDEMVRYYVRLSSYEPLPGKEQYYNQILETIDKMVGLLNK